MDATEWILQSEDLWLNHNTRGSELIVQKKRSKLTYDKYDEKDFSEKRLL